MLVNPKITEVCKQHGLDPRKGIMFCFAVSQPRYDLLDLLVEMDILDGDNEPVFRLHFCTIDEEGQVALRLPLYVNDDSFISYPSFVKQYLQKHGMIANGHRDNPMMWKIVDNAEEQYMRMLASIPDVNYDKLAAVIAAYYKKTEKASALSKFLGPSCLLEYDSFEEDETRLI